MNEIWANRLIAGDKKWINVPSARKAGVKAALYERMVSGEITAEQYQEITGETIGA